MSVASNPNNPSLYLDLLEAALLDTIYSSDVSESQHWNSDRAGQIATDAEIEEGQYWIKASKKGGLPVGLETRKKGKKVTVISNVHGDGNALLAALKVCDLSYLCQCVFCVSFVNAMFIFVHAACVLCSIKSGPCTCSED